MSDSPHNSLERLREQVVEQLSASYSRDFLSQDEFEQRIETATAAGTHAELRSLIVDLPVAGSPNAPAVSDTGSPAAYESGGRYVVNHGEVAEERTLVAIFSGTDRKGVWNPPKRLHTIAVFGGSDIDLRDARIPPGGMRIVAFALFGAVDIIVPEGVRVEVSGGGIFGAFEGKEDAQGYGPDAPVIQVEGAAIFGAVEVKHKKRK
jgi:hypothetical protein